MLYRKLNGDTIIHIGQKINYNDSFWIGFFHELNEFLPTRNAKRIFSRNKRKMVSVLAVFACHLSENSANSIDVIAICHFDNCESASFNSISTACCLPFCRFCLSDFISSRNDTIFTVVSSQLIRFMPKA